MSMTCKEESILCFANDCTGNLFDAAEKRRVVQGSESEFEVGLFMSAMLSCDHRVIDGILSVAASHCTHI